MNRKEFDVTRKVELPKEIIIQEALGRYVALDPASPNWIVVDHDECLLLDQLRKESIIDAMKALVELLGISEKRCITISKDLLEKIDRSNFYISNEGAEEENIKSVKKNIQINLTSDCNIRCKHCYLSAGIGEKHYLDREKIVAFIDSLERERLSDEIVLSGGEPFLYEELEGLVLDLRQRNFSAVIFSNGTLLDEDRVDSMRGGISAVQLSMEGISEKAFESVRGKGTYKKLCSALMSLKKLRIRVVLAITVFEEVIEDVEANLFGFLRWLDYDDLEVRINSDIERKGNVEKFPDFFASSTDSLRLRVNRIISRLINDGFSFPADGGKSNRFTNCGIGASIVLDSTGVVYPCNEFIDAVGVNINDQDSENLVQKLDDINASTSVKNIESCSECELMYVCCGGCKVKNKNVNGDYLAPVCDKQGVYNRMVLSEMDLA